MKPFTLEEYLKNPERKIVDSQKRPVRIICTDRKAYNDNCVITGLVLYNNNCEVITVCTPTGKDTCDKQIFYFAPIKKSVWVALIKYPSGVLDSLIFNDYSDIEAFRKNSPNVTILKEENFKWEE